MKLDDVSTEIVHNLRNTLESEGIIISIQEIVEIVESQFVIANLAFKKGLEIRLPMFGTFVRKHGYEKSVAGALLNEMKDSMSTEAFERKVLEAKLANKESMKITKKGMTRITFSQLKDTKDLVGVKNRYDKVL